MTITQPFFFTGRVMEGNPTEPTAGAGEHTDLNYALFAIRLYALSPKEYFPPCL